MFRKIFIYTIILLLSQRKLYNSNLICNAETLSSNDLKDENIQLKHQIKTLEGTISLLKDALDELGAATPNNVVNIWAKGIQTRNGYLQYYILCDRMKNEFKEELSKSQRTSWVTGYLSPWVSSYDIVNIEKINSLKYRFTINFNLDTSIGPKDSTESTVITTKIDNKWCINDIEWNDTMKKRIF